ncbi:MAG: chemotaxis protein CheW [Pseudomonadota bacterium]|jgi:purine-binding chemotaxis protein CheW
MSPQSSNAPAQLVTFRTGDYHFGVDVLEVQEVLKQQQMTPVPRAAAEVRGLINLRGHIVTAIGMRERLRLQPLDDISQQMNLIVSLRDGAASLVVDSVGDVISLDPKRYKPKPSTLSAPLLEMVSGVYQLDHGLLLHIDAEAAVNLFGDDQRDS